MYGDLVMEHEKAQWLLSTRDDMLVYPILLKSLKLKRI